MEDAEIYKVKRNIPSKLEDNESYQTYHKSTLREVPFDTLKILLKLFFDRAAINMGKDSYDASTEAVDSICEFTNRRFGYLPVYLAASCIIKGSLGQYGAGRLVPRTVYIWLTEATHELDKQQRHETLMSTDTGVIMDLHKYPVGKAINTKIDWLVSGRITESDYDKIPLQAMYERMSQGLDVVPELWGVTSKKKKDVW